MGWTVSPADSHLKPYSDHLRMGLRLETELLERTFRLSEAMRGDPVPACLMRKKEERHREVLHLLTPRSGATSPVGVTT